MVLNVQLLGRFLITCSGTSYSLKCWCFLLLCVELYPLFWGSHLASSPLPPHNHVLGNKGDMPPNLITKWNFATLGDIFSYRCFVVCLGMSKQLLGLTRDLSTVTFLQHSFDGPEKRLIYELRETLVIWLIKYLLVFSMCYRMPKCVLKLRRGWA